MSYKLTLTLGGHLDTVEQASALVAAIVSECLDDDQGEYISTKKIAQSAMRRAIENNSSLELTEIDHDNGGSLHDIDPLIEAYPSLQKMVFMHSQSGADTIERTYTLDGKLQCTSVDTLNYGGALISSLDIKVALSTDTPVESIQALLDKAEIDAGSDFPPLTASPAVQTWLKIFGGRSA